ncbi:2-hydroxychromene-2-carboxylate isomerase [Pandoraea pulmonicola]|uniref:2-hydroxychromene-2-carboxylate isomerase n=1 Tax=Pandoraea pulmonicola TaxID=93221 RepID=A0AAJ4ZBD2_PANPU|nr:2-hydroxychromene-2-carboxylate isomerase [Pandoraea pulmonicola]AJC21129.1 2-hydroxychromene-2-carboxylate isomerase [Pandoraea pulmonicola]SUA90207.1 2-hydroxychromene-2-carboxylate isomerase [Pandoraea pulmonicola]
MSLACDYFLAPPSPYVYMGHARFVELARRYDVQIQLKPVDLGRIFSSSGGLPLAKRAPQRQAYRLVELARWSKYLGIPLNPQPKFFPVAGDPAARLIVAVQLAHGTDRALDLTAAISKALWVDERNIADDATLQAIADGLSLDGKSLVAASSGASVQAAYDANTEDAMNAGVFGAPWFMFQGEPYWGQDRLDFLERAFAEARDARR